MDRGEGLDGDLEMLVTDPKLPDADCIVRAIIPYNMDGTLHEDFFKGNVLMRPKEERRLIELVLKERHQSPDGLSRWDKLPLGLVRWQLKDGYVTGTSFPLLPPRWGETVYQSVDHNLPAETKDASRVQVALTMCNGDHDYVGRDYESVLSVICRGPEDRWEGSNLNRDYRTPTCSPSKGGAVSRVFVPNITQEDSAAPGSEAELEPKEDEEAEEEDTEDEEGGSDESVELDAAALAEQDALFQMWEKQSYLESGGGQGGPMERKGMSRQKRENLAGRRKQSVKVHGPEPLTPSKDRSSQTVGGPDFGFFTAPTSFDTRHLPNIWNVPDGDDIVCATYTAKRGWHDGDDVYIHGLPYEDADPQYWKDNYGMGIHTARLTAAMADKVYRPRLKGISPGKVIAQTETTARITCSATRGSSGSPVSRLKTPLAVTMMHFRAKREYRDNEEVFPSNLALKMNAPEVVLHYARHIVPRLLERLEDQDWPQKHKVYMKSKLRNYLRRHNELLRAKGLWEQCSRLIEVKLGEV